MSQSLSQSMSTEQVVLSLNGRTGSISKQELLKMPFFKSLSESDINFGSTTCNMGTKIFCLADVECVLQYQIRQVITTMEPESIVAFLTCAEFLGKFSIFLEIR